MKITEFDGTFEQWLPFWNKYKAEVDSTDLPPVTKFAYLKELVEPKVRSNIDGLPFTTEGYERAKNILQSEYGKESEIIHAYVNNIMGLPTITDSSPKQVEDFYKKLLYNVQSLETPWRSARILNIQQASANRLVCPFIFHFGAYFIKIDPLAQKL